MFIIFTGTGLDRQVMRTPLQILFLILVTDLPPSIALGMEPGTIRRSYRFGQTRSILNCDIPI